MLRRAGNRDDVRRRAPAPTPAPPGPWCSRARSAIADSPSSSDRLQGRWSAWKRGMLWRISLGGRCGDAAQAAGQETARQRAECHHRDAELAARVQHGHLGIARPQRVLGLHGRDRVHGMRCANRGRRHLRQPDRLDLAGLDQAGQRADAVLDRHLLVAAVQVVEVDGLDPQPRQAFVAVLRRSPRAARPPRAGLARCGTSRPWWPAPPRAQRCFSTWPSSVSLAPNP